VDVVLHCAAVGGSRLTGYDKNCTDVVEKNLRMFVNLLRSLPEQAHTVHLGSGAEYAKPHYRSKMPETYFDTHVPTDAYGFSKYVISRLIASQERVTCLRLFGLYGKYEDYRYKFISNAIVKNLLGLPIVIKQNVVFDYLFVDDFVEIVERFVEKRPKQRFYNITPSESIDLLTVSQLINQTSDFQSETVVLNKGLNTEYSGDNARILTELGGFSFTPYTEGIAKLHHYYRSVLDTLDTATVRLDPYLQHCQTRTQ
jgi:GDP-L-fucose synthase